MSVSKLIPLCLIALVQSSLALGPGGGAIIRWHPDGCGSNTGVIQLANPGNTATSPPCIMNLIGFPNNNSAGGWEIQKLPTGVNFEVRQGPPGGLVCGPELILSVSQDGCYTLDQLAGVAWWDFCITGEDCELPSKRIARSAPPSTNDTILRDDKGEYMIALTGERIPVYRQQGTTDVDIPTPQRRWNKRQTNTFDPPQSCVNDVFACIGLADSGELKAICVNCVKGFGNGVVASSSIDCRFSGGACPVTFMSSITVTDTISDSITFGANIGDTGEAGLEGTFTFGLSESFSVAVEKGFSLGLNIPQGHVGFVQYQPPAVLGTVITSVGDQNFCNGNPSDQICGAAPGILATSNNDVGGQYSVVLTS